MKRTLTLLISLLLLVSLLIPAADAVQTKAPADSTYIRDEICEKFDASQTTLIRTYIYNPRIVYRQSHTNLKIEKNFFNSGDTIDDIISRIHPSSYIALWNNGKIEYLTGSVYPNGQYQTYTPNIGIRTETLNFYLQTDLSAYLGSDVSIHQKYLLYDSNSTEGIILYRTSKGNYVFFENDQVTPCLFSLEAFLAYQHLVYEVNYAISPEQPKYNICDLSKYELGSPVFDPNVNDIPWVPNNLIFHLCIGILLLLCIVIIAVVLIYKAKIKPHNPYESVQSTEFDTDFVIYHTINDPVDTAENLPLTPN